MTTHQLPRRRVAAGVGPPVDVLTWRCSRLVEVGFDPALAMGLARSSVDVHALLNLVDRGCPPFLAARILAPLPGEW